ncbi:nickel-dependent lactate racemase family protein [Paenibacillus alkalitolerans]|uniref:nickel-dependent lactate racemase n=1 Tax=Paenibacillus alkalitolerans TaxID=2799335 RepID=UPI0018F6256C|nr:nickel-dependent lactate racemase [Paenibacillus alkalitolerans]
MLLAYGNGAVDITLPESIQTDTIMYNIPASAFLLADEIIKRALRQPVNSAPLRDIARGKSDAVILISDISRLCPSYLFLPHLLDELNAGGIADERITVVVALGLHRRQTVEELRFLTGAAYDRVNVENHCALPEQCTYVGSTALGTEVAINKRVVQGDLRIATGNIEPHRLVGISGGAKALFPGVASSSSIEQHHSLSHRFKAFPGDPDNPLHKDLTDVLKFVPIHFLFNVVVTHRREIAAAVAGNLQDAHRQGTDLARSMFLVPVSKKYDVVIASTGGYPKDMQLYQAVKTLENAASVTKPGGDIVLIARCQELFGNGMFQLWVETMGDLEATAERLSKEFVIGAHKIEHVVKVTKQHNVFLYSDIPDAAARLLGFEPIHNLDEKIAALCNGKASLAVLPCGSITYPV